MYIAKKYGIMVLVTCTCVLYFCKATFGVEVVQISARNRNVYHFATKLCNFTIFAMLFSAVVMDFVFHVSIKI